MQSLLNFFSSLFQGFGRTKKQKLFEEKLYQEGLQKEQTKVIQLINQNISSEEMARKFMLQELDMLRKGDALSQNFVEKSGFHLAEYLGASKKFEEDRESIQAIQNLLMNFLEQISNEKTMLQSARIILNEVMKYWEIGKYSEEGKLFIQENEMKSSSSLEKKSKTSTISFSLKNLQSSIMDKLIYADDQIQKVLDKFSALKAEAVARKSIEKEESKTKIEPKEKSKRKIEPALAPKIEKPQATVKIYNDEKIYELMEEYSSTIEELITGQIHPKNQENIAIFQEHISLALLEGNNLASVFYPFFDTRNSFENLSVPIITMNDKSKKFFIDILNSFQKKGFSKHLYDYLDENQDAVYALATKNDMFMQYLIAFWYAKQEEDEAIIRFWYEQSASNGFVPAIKKIEEGVV